MGTWEVHWEMEYWVDRRGYCYITWSFTIAMRCHNDFPKSSNYYLLSSNSYTQHRPRLTKIWWQSHQKYRNYSISRYSDHSRLLDMPFTSLVTSMTWPTAQQWLETWLEKLWQWLAKTRIRDWRLEIRQSWLVHGSDNNVRYGVSRFNETSAFKRLSTRLPFNRVSKITHW